MPDNAATQLARIVALVAELSRRDRRGARPATLKALGASFGVSPADIARDIRTLTLLGDHADAEWLLSLSVWQQEDRVSVTSAGPFQRPIRLSPDEMLALQVALAMDPNGAPVARKLATTIAAATAAPVAAPASAVPAMVPDFHAVMADAVSNQRPVELLYTGEGERTPGRWLIHPHQLVTWRERTYIVAWSEQTDDWRHFRFDRIIEARLMEGTFARRADFRPVIDPADLFRPGDAEPDAVRVRFASGIARWIKDRYRDCTELEDGGVEVTLRASGAEWLVRRVLEYGDQAVVVSPAAYREAVRRAVA
jgi:proteasome accessory factor C